MTYTTGYPLAADHGSLPRRETRKSLGKGRIHPQTFRHNRREVRQSLDRFGFDILFASESATDLAHGLLERLRILEQVERDARETGRGTLASSQDYERGVCVQLLDGHRHSFLALDDVRQKIRMVRFRRDASVNLVAVEAEDLVLSGFHRLGNHQSDNLV